MDHSSASPNVRYSYTGAELLGSFYDDTQQRIVGYSNLRAPIQSTASTQPARFYAFFGKSDQTIHSFHSIDNQPSLPSYEDLVERIRLVASKSDSRPIDEYTRFLYYSWPEREEFYPDNVVHSVSINKLRYMPRAATHLFIRLAYGIDVIIILRLSPDLDIAPIDDELKQSQASFRPNDSFPALTLLEKYSDQRKVRMIISSTASPLRSYLYISHLRDQIERSKRDGNSIWPIFSSFISFKEPPPMARKKPIRILLLGQTGVGKSTFINALANYLTFDTLKQAEDGTPQVIIPVSFIITSGFYFDEQNITFGPQDPTHNENFNDRGHSVTQQCRSYTFDLPQSNTQICIIDTPGFGDTRGIDQDEVNITHITDYLRELPQLDAICCLFKPNESKMSILFRTCFMQLFSVIDRDAYDKVLFCFTNSRSTFYAPGNTGPLVRKMLETLSTERGVEVKMEKKNTFCFDNEAFRYLVARMNRVEFKPDEQEEYANSWKVSVKTAKQLLEHVRQRSTQTT